MPVAIAPSAPCPEALLQLCGGSAEAVARARAEVGRQQQPFRRRADRRDLREFPVPVAALPARGFDEFAERRDVYDADRRHVADLQSEQHTVERDAVDERVSAVNRIDEPAAAGAPYVFAFLFAEDGIVGEASLDLRAQEFFRLAVGRGHPRAVSLALGREGAPKVAQSDLARRARKLRGRFHQLA